MKYFFISSVWLTFWIFSFPLEKKQLARNNTIKNVLDQFH